MQATATSLKGRRDLRQVLRDAFAYFRGDWRGFVTIGAATIPFALISSAVQFSIDDALAQQLATGAVFILTFPAFALVEGAIIAHLTALAGNRPATEAQSYREALKRLGPLLGASARLIAVCVGLSITIIGIPLAILFAVRWLFIPQAVMLDGASASEAPRASAETVRGFWWLTLGRTLTVALFVVAINVVILSLIATGPEGIYALVSAIIGAFTAPYFSIALTLAYFDLKVRKAEAEPV
jgi:hypothetical protein